MTTVLQKKPSEKELLTGNDAVAEAVRLAKVDVIPAYPITPQTGVVQTVSSMVADGRLNAEYIAVESEHSAMAAAIGSSLGGARTFTATSSHGLLYMMEMVYWAGYTRVPLVMALINRSLSPWNIWVDHTDMMSMRDSGWIHLVSKNNQEVLDLTLISFRLSEHHKVWMPAAVSLDGFILSHTSQLVDIPSEEQMDKFIKPIDPLFHLTNENPIAHAALTPPAGIVEQRESLMEGMKAAKILFKEINKEYQELVGRDFGDYLEITPGCPGCDPKLGVICLGTMAEEAEEAVIFLHNEKNVHAKVIRPRMIRPFPKEEIVDEIKKLEKVLIIDRSASFGYEGAGPLAIEIKAALFEAGVTNVKVVSRITGLGGSDINYRDIAKMIMEL